MRADDKVQVLVESMCLLTCILCTRTITLECVQSGDTWSWQVRFFLLACAIRKNRRKRGKKSSNGNGIEFQEQQDLGKNVGKSFCLDG